MLSQKCLFVCPLLKFGEDICFPRNVNLPSLFLNLGKKSASPCFEIWGRFMLPKNVSLPSLFSNLGKKCFSRNVCLSALGNCLPCFWIWGRNMLPQICEFAFPVFEFGEEICFPRNVRLPSLFFKFGEELCFPRNVSLPSLVRNYGKTCASPEMWVRLPCFQIWGRNMRPQKYLSVCPVLKFGEEICLPRK